VPLNPKHTDITELVVDEDLFKYLQDNYDKFEDVKDKYFIPKNNFSLRDLATVCNDIQNDSDGEINLVLLKKRDSYKVISFNEIETLFSDIWKDASGYNVIYLE